MAVVSKAAGPVGMWGLLGEEVAAWWEGSEEEFRGEGKALKEAIPGRGDMGVESMGVSGGEVREPR